MRRTIAWGVTAAVLSGLVAFVVTAVVVAPDAPVADDDLAALAASARTSEAVTADDRPTTDPPPATPPPSTPAPSDPVPSEPGDRADDGAGAVGVSSARLSDVQDDPEPTPVALEVPSIGVADAPIDPVGIEPDGAMEIPEDIRRIGWYEYGPEPGADQGSAVLTAHIDSRTQGRGVFYDLDELAIGEPIEVTMSDGSVRRFEALGTRRIPKVDLPTGEVFRRDGEPVLALITCGGEFDPSSRHYRDNIVVLATPLG